MTFLGILMLFFNPKTWAKFYSFNSVTLMMMTCILYFECFRVKINT